MPRKKESKIDKILLKPVWEGRMISPMWTGMIRPDDIDEYLIRDPEKRAEFSNLVKQYEELVRKYRGIHSTVTDPTKSTITIDADDIEEYTRVVSEDRTEPIWKIANQIATILRNGQKYGLDTNLLLIRLCQCYEEILEKNPHEFDRADETLKQELKRLKKEVEDNYTASIVTFDTDKERYVLKAILSAKPRAIFSARGSKNTEKLKEVLQSITGESDISLEDNETLRYISKFLDINDLYKIYCNEDFSTNANFATIKNTLLQVGFSRKQIEEYDVDELLNQYQYIEERFELPRERGFVFANTIVDNIDSIDVEKYLLLSMEKMLESFEEDLTDREVGLIFDESEKNSSENKPVTEALKYKVTTERMKKVEQIIRSILASKVIGPSTRIDLEKDGKRQNITIGRIEKLMEKYCDGIYLSDNMEANLLIRSLKNPDEMSTWSDELVKRLEYEPGFLIYSSLLSTDNLKRLYSLGKLSKEDISGILKITKLEDFEEKVKSTSDSSYETSIDSILKNSKEFLNNLYKLKIFTAEDLKKHFDEGAISFEDIEQVLDSLNEEEKSSFIDDMKSGFGYQTLLEKYKDFVEKDLHYRKIKELCPDHEEELAEFKRRADEAEKEKDKYLKVFKLFGSSMSKEEIDDMLGTYYLDMGVEKEDLLQESLLKMYEDKIIQLENILTVGSEYIIPMLDKLTLQDAKEIRKLISMEQLEKMLDAVFLDDNCKYKFSDQRKFIIAMNLLNEETEEDRDLRELYLSTLPFNKEERLRNSSSRRNKLNNPTNTFNKYIYPDSIKWKFFQSLDPNMVVKMYTNGYVEFSSPKLDCRIIEKYYEEGKKVYGHATFLVPNDIYKENEDRLVTEVLGNESAIIEPSILRDITPPGNKVIHRTQSKDRTWMDDIIKHLNIDFEREDDSRYSPEELKSIQKEIESLKRKYERID